MRRWIPGRPLVGFHGIFEGDFGDPETESPMRVITPSFVGNSLLPFRCPRCREVAQDLACPVTREHYRDRREGRDNHFCPGCGCRFRIDLRGTPLPCALPTGAVVGPSKVDCGGEVTWQDAPGVGAGVLGVVLGMLLGGSSWSGYEVLAKRV